MDGVSFEMGADLRDGHQRNLADIDLQLNRLPTPIRDAAIEAILRQFQSLPYAFRIAPAEVKREAFAFLGTLVTDTRLPIRVKSTGRR